MLMSIIFSWVGAGVALIAGIVCLIFTIAALFNNRGERVLAWVPGVAAVICGILWIWFSTSTVVAPNTTLLVVDSASGKPDPNLRKPGLVGVPFLGSQTFSYPTQTAWQWCPAYTPSVKGGASVTVTICYTVDASEVDWLAEYLKYNGDVTIVTDGWQRETSQLVAETIANYDPRQLTNQRGDVVNALALKTAEWWATRVRVAPQVIVLANWQFANQALNDAYDQALLSQTQVDKANFELEAARVQMETAYVRADAQVEVAKRLAVGQSEACRLASMNTTEACLEYLRVIWLNSQTPQNLIVSVGGDANPAVAIPAAQATPLPTAQPVAP